MCSTATQTALYCGRVAHTRFKPVLHSFSYPLFFCFLDLSEVGKIFEGGRKSMLWPLNLLMSFREEDHLKNGEGLLCNTNDTHENSADSNTLPFRIRRLVSERTGGKCNPTADQKICLLTHLCYFGYCFNPVSFYYILKGNTMEEEDNIEAIVAEVSNTPWNEMKCYVLHPDSKDIEIVQDGRSRKILDDDNIKSINYVFKKRFHVSPFMEMDYIYDWTFWHLRESKIAVTANMVKLDEKDNANVSKDVKNGTKHFNAFFDINRSSFTPFSLCYQLVRWPVYCFIIQIWIHVEALKLFIKGVEFIPHPEGSETMVSSMIAAIMTPFFELKEYIASKRVDKSD